MGQLAKLTFPVHIEALFPFFPALCDVPDLFVKATGDSKTLLHEPNTYLLHVIPVRLASRFIEPQRNDRSSFLSLLNLRFPLQKLSLIFHSFFCVCEF